MPPSAEADLVHTRDRLLPRGLWVAESLLSAAACVAFVLAYACALLILAILLGTSSSLIPGTCSTSSRWPCSPE